MNNLHDQRSISMRQPRSFRQIARKQARKIAAPATAYPLLRISAPRPSGPMGYFNESLNDGLDRLQRLLLEMRNGDELGCDEAARLSGLNPDVCRTVLEGLTRAGLMSQEPGDRFVRRTLDAFTS
jgi:hypothetical protein